MADFLKNIFATLSKSWRAAKRWLREEPKRWRQDTKTFFLAPHLPTRLLQKAKSLVLDPGILFNTCTVLAYAHGLVLFALPVHLITYFGLGWSVLLKIARGDKATKTQTMASAPVMGILIAALLGFGAHSMLANGTKLVLAEKSILGAIMGGLIALGNSIQMRRFSNPRSMTEVHDSSKPLLKRVAGGLLTALSFPPVWSAVGVIMSGLISSPGVLTKILVTGSLASLPAMTLFTMGLGTVLVAASVVFQAINHARGNPTHPGWGRYILGWGCMVNFGASLMYGMDNIFPIIMNGVSIFSQFRVGRIERQEYLKLRAKEHASTDGSATRQYLASGPSADLNRSFGIGATPAPPITPLLSTKRELRVDPRARLMKIQRRDWRPGF